MAGNCFCVRLWRIFSFRISSDSCLGGAGRDRCTGRGECNSVLADLDCNLDGRCAWRLAILLDRLEAGKSRLPHMAFVLSSASHFEGRGVRKEMGGLGIFVGRFFGPLRSIVPLVAGIFVMPYWPFQLANFASAFVWASVILQLGKVGSKILIWLWE